MKIDSKIKCAKFPCSDIDKKSYAIPSIEVDAERIKVLTITEAPPDEKADYFYSAGNPFYLQTIVQAFRDADVSSIQDILDLGAYITTAIECGKTQYAISSETTKNCSKLLEQELALFPATRVFMLMGDVAIRMMNDIWKRQTGKKIVATGSTYKIRGGRHITKEIEESSHHTHHLGEIFSLRNPREEWWPRTSERHCNG